MSTPDGLVHDNSQLEVPLCCNRLPNLRQMLLDPLFGARQAARARLLCYPGWSTSARFDQSDHGFHVVSFKPEKALDKCVFNSCLFPYVFREKLGRLCADWVRPASTHTVAAVHSLTAVCAGVKVIIQEILFLQFTRVYFLS